MTEEMNEKDTLFRLDAKPLEPSGLLREIEKESFISFLGNRIYGNTDRGFLEAQRKRYIQTVELHVKRYGERPTFLIRAPGRLNLFMEYLDMCGGDHMSTTIDGDIPAAVSPAMNSSGKSRGRVRICNTNHLFGEAEFSIAEELARFKSRSWSKEAANGIPDNWEGRSLISPHHGRPRGDWLNYVLAPYLRASFEWPEIGFSGCDMTFGPSSIPIRAGTSSSSAVVVLSLLSLILAEQDRLPRLGVRKLCRFLGEAEWYVGTRGGANDQTTILRNRTNSILYNLHHLDLIDSRPVPWLDGMAVLLCNTLWEADKALGARDVFNLRKGWMDLARDLLLGLTEAATGHLAAGRSRGPGWLRECVAAALPGIEPPASSCLESRTGLWSVLSERFSHLGSLDNELLGLDTEAIDEFIDLLPERITAEQAGRALSKDLAAMERDYTLPLPEDGGYKPRQAARFFHIENRIGRNLESVLCEAHARAGKGELAPESEEYDAYRVKVADHLNSLQVVLRDLFEVSNSQIELLLSIAGNGPGFMAGKLTGAGSGGCVCILVHEEDAAPMLDWLDAEYFGKEENFSVYRKTLSELAASPDEAYRRKAAELVDNLESALSSPEEHRRKVSFSNGAGVISPEEFGGM